jgi:type IV fimbrial biogenesis protein FimT
VQPVSARRGCRAAAGAAGFTLIEALVALAILAGLLALGVPRMSEWVQANKAAGAAQFYAEGFTLARTQAVTHNGASRLVLTENPANGQMDWQVDVCFPTASVPCNAESGGWSTTTTPATRPGEAGPRDGDFKSVLRRADSLPATSLLAHTLSPSGATDVYFTSLGWVDTNFSPRLARIGLAPASGHAGAFPASAVVLTLAGIASKCDPNAASHDSRRCPP